MTEEIPSRLTLATPTQFDLVSFRDQLAAALDAVPVACVRLSLASRDEEALARAGDVLREVSHARDVPIIVDDHHGLVTRIGLDGVHLTDGHRRVRELRKALGEDAIVGAYCGTSRHNGMTAAELGADYVSFGPITPAPLLGEEEVAPTDLFIWWSEMIEVPVMAEGRLDDAALQALAPVADFVCLSDEVWLSPDGPIAALERIAGIFD
ncbi:thiamine phosphate synthase [Oceanibium sediminis]|uniref:thiamine phosphate synthase n=1 Tax=Oceanibium sediminis TaxID=2026339 RepID=UPI000DD4A81A|nr:thiamine phosphate synthase [Oceanibium sediminis]